MPWGARTELQFWFLYREQYSSMDNMYTIQYKQRREQANDNQATSISLVGQTSREV